jgi:hypothetical protein
MKTVVGISQKIKREWLDAALDRLAQTGNAAELRIIIDMQLKRDLPGNASRAKRVGIISSIWSGMAPGRAVLRDRAIAMLPKISASERIWLHWGMAASAYPFFRDTAEVVGRLLALQDDFTTAQVQARMVTAWGDRVTSKRAVKYLLHTLVDWEVLRSTKAKAHYLLARKLTTNVSELQLWLLEALLAASSAHEIEAQQLLRLPESFPFAITVGVADLRKYEGFDIHRQGLDMDMITLRKMKSETLPTTARKMKSKKTPDQASLFNTPATVIVSGNGKPDAVPQVRATAQDECSVVQRQRIDESIKSEVLRTLSERADRFLKVRGTVLVPFAALSTECVEQFHDGRYFGCIALTQILLEAVIRHIWQVKLKKPHQERSFDKYLEALNKNGFISDECKSKLKQIWDDRHLFYRMCPSVGSDLQKLQELARNGLTLLNDIEREFFGFTLREGMVVPEFPEYWSNKK